MAELKLNPSCASAGSELCLGWQSEIFSSAKPIQFPCHIKEICMNTALRPQALSTIVPVNDCPPSYPQYIPMIWDLSVAALPHPRRKTLGFPTCILCVDRRRPLRWGREKRHETLRGDIQSNNRRLMGLNEDIMEWIYIINYNYIYMIVYLYTVIYIDRI